MRLIHPTADYVLWRCPLCLHTEVEPRQGVEPEQWLTLWLCQREHHGWQQEIERVPIAVRELEVA